MWAEIRASSTEHLYLPLHRGLVGRRARRRVDTSHASLPKSGSVLPVSRRGGVVPDHEVFVPGCYHCSPTELYEPPSPETGTGIDGRSRGSRIGAHTSLVTLLLSSGSSSRLSYWCESPPYLLSPFLFVRSWIVVTFLALFNRSSFPTNKPYL